MASESPSNRLPFEPGGNRKKAEKAAAKPDSQPSKPDKLISKKSAGKRRKESGIPPVVSRRMIRRVAVLSGIPSFMGISIFFVSYYLLIQNIIELPTIAVLLATLGCFGLGVLGISYGVLSASWDEKIVGTKLGWSEFTLNLGRLRSARQTPKASK